MALLLALSFPSRVHSEPPKAPEPPPAPKDIRYFAELYGADYALAHAIAMCESRLVATAKNPHSTAKGVYQFLDGTWEYYGLKKWGTLEGRSVLSFTDNIELGVWVIATYGTQDWDASKHCWA